MPTPFSDPRIWQQAIFIFTLQSLPQAVDARGNVSSEGRAIAITFKLRPSGDGSLQKGEAADTGNPVYDCRVVAVNGDLNQFILPSDIRLGDIGTGVLNGRECMAIVKSVAQSSVSPIVAPILGSGIKLEIDYRVRRGSSA